MMRDTPDQPASFAEIILNSTKVLALSGLTTPGLDARQQGYIAFISLSRIAITKFDKGISDVDLVGKIIEGTLDELVIDHASNPDCIGIIPISWGVEDTLQSYGLIVKNEDIIPKPMGYIPPIYGL